jgi:hypothetical protein
MQPSELLRQIRELDQAITKMIEKAKELQDDLKNK